MRTPVDALPEIVEVSEPSAAWRAGLRPGDRIISVNGVVPRDILEWHRLVDDERVDVEILRGRESVEVSVEPRMGEPFGVRISSAVFDRIHTCDNHCEFCFIYQLPKGMRRSLYVKDDDYRLSFLYGNFTTLTRFTEADLERVIDERLSPLYVSVHAVDPHVRSTMLRNPRGGFSFRWAKLLLAAGIDVRAQIVVCPGVNDGDVLEDTLAGLMEQAPGIESIAVVPLGLSRFNTESRMRVQSVEEAATVIAIVEKWQGRHETLFGHNPIHLSDEFYMVAGRPVPEANHYGGYPMLEDGVGLVRSFIDSFRGLTGEVPGRHDGFFAAVDVPNPTAYTVAANPAADTGLRAVTSTPVSISKLDRPVSKPLAILTGTYGARMFRGPLADELDGRVHVVEVVNEYFGGNTAVAGLMTHADIARTLAAHGNRYHYLLPDVCLNDGIFLDGLGLDDLAGEFDIEVIPTSGAALRRRIAHVAGKRDHVREH